MVSVSIIGAGRGGSTAAANSWSFNGMALNWAAAETSSSLPRKYSSASISNSSPLNTKFPSPWTVDPKNSSSASAKKTAAKTAWAVKNLNGEKEQRKCSELTAWHNLLACKKVTFHICPNLNDRSPTMAWPISFKWNATRRLRHHLGNCIKRIATAALKQAITGLIHDAIQWAGDFPCSILNGFFTVLCMQSKWPFSRDSAHLLLSYLLI